MEKVEALNPKTTALVVIDLQNRIVALGGAPYSSKEVVDKAAQLVEAFRQKEAFVALVRVDSRDGRDILRPQADELPKSASGSPVLNGAEIVQQIGVTQRDHLITKHQWGAFYGTDLDLQLRRRGIETIVLCGIATGYGVDTTAREAYQRGYQQVFVTDAMTGLSEEEHNYVLKYIFPRIGKLRRTDEVLAALTQ